MNFLGHQMKKMYNIAKQLYCELTISVLTLNYCLKKMETEKE